MKIHDYINNRCPCGKADKEHLKKFASELFKKGWEFSVEPSYTDFTKGDVSTGEHRLVLPEKHSRGAKDVVKYSYRKNLTPTRGGLSRSHHFSTFIDIDHPDYMIEELNELFDRAKSST